MKNFSTAKPDSSTLMYSVFIFGICIASIITLFLGLNIDQSFRWVIIAILVGVLVSSYLMIPKLAVNKDYVIIKNAFVNIKIPVAEIQNLERYERVGLNLRTFGVGGLFGYFGYFNGKQIWYVTNIKKKVRIMMRSGKIYVISPADPDEFVREVKKQQSPELR